MSEILHKSARNESKGAHSLSSSCSCSFSSSSHTERTCFRYPYNSINDAVITHVCQIKAATCFTLLYAWLYHIGVNMMFWSLEVSWGLSRSCFCLFRPWFDIAVRLTNCPHWHLVLPSVVTSIQMPRVYRMFLHKEKPNHVSLPNRPPQRPHCQLDTHTQLLICLISLSPFSHKRLQSQFGGECLWAIASSMGMISWFTSESAGSPWAFGRTWQWLGSWSCRGNKKGLMCSCTKGRWSFWNSWFGSCWNILEHQVQAV